MKINKKSQMEIGQTMMILIVFFILLIFALIFFIRFQSSEQSVKTQEWNEQNMVEKAQLVYSLGEIGCSIDNVIKYDCIDILKLNAFKEQLKFKQQSNLYYRKIFGNLKIEIEELYPVHYGINMTGNNALYDTKPKYLVSSRSIQMPIVLYNASDSVIGSYYFGIMTVTSYFRVTER